MVYDRRTIGMRELALFAGAGGGILGGKMLGWRTVCAVEIEDYPRRVILQRQRDEILDKFPIWDDVRTFDGRPWCGKVDVISGGFPCQDISAAGKGAGIENGERSGLWREYARIVRTIRPEYVFVENSPMLTVRGLGIVLGDLASLGYDAKWKVLSAEDCGAPHERERIWIVAKMADTVFDGLQRSGRDGIASRQIGLCRRERSDEISHLSVEWGRKWWEVEPGLGRMADGVDNRMDRIKAIGNGQVPIVAARAFLELM